MKEENKDARPSLVRENNGASLDWAMFDESTNIDMERLNKLAENIKRPMSVEEMFMPSIFRLKKGDGQ